MVEDCDYDFDYIIASLIKDVLFTFNLIGIFKLKPILKKAVNVFVLMQVML